MKRFAPFILIITSLSLYADANLKADYRIVPLPKNIEMDSTQIFTLQDNMGIAYDASNPEVARITQFLIDWTRQATGLRLTLAPEDKHAAIRLTLGDAKSNSKRGKKSKKSDTTETGEQQPEAYTIKVNKTGICLQANQPVGLFRAAQTLRKSLPIQQTSSSDAPNSVELPFVLLSDAPRFSYRGVLLDCARHFYPVEDIKKTLDLMLVFKLNRFHWHLTDDQGWRVEIKRYPLLTQVGAFRSGTMVGKDFESNDGVRYGGYYTQEQMREIVEYADERGITVIPEIDLPGHMQGALAAYPSLGCTGGPYEVRTIWGVSEQVLCAGKEETYRFLEDVFTELMDIFPSEYFHIGGDECPKKEWSQCPACQERIRALGLKADEKHSAEVYLQNYVTARVQKFLSDHGRKIIGWDEIFEGDLAEGATVMSWRGVESGLKAAAAGYDVVMTPKWYCYLNYLQSEDPTTEPLGHGHFLPLDKAYSYEPFEGLDAAAEDHILGVQANMWTEYIGTQDYMEYMLLPRLCAIAEVNWSRRQDRDYDRFHATLQRKTYSLFKTLGYNYRTY